MALISKLWITQKFQKTDLEFAEELTEKYGVASIPVSVFSEKDKHKNMLRFVLQNKMIPLEKPQIYYAKFKYRSFTV